MISISSPVYSADEFKGAVSIDISLDKLVTILETGLVSGESYIVDESWKIVASQEGFSVGDSFETSLKVPSSQHYYESNGFVDYYIPIVSNELYLVHRMNFLEKNKIIFNSMSLYLSLFTFIVVITYLIISLAQTLFRVNQLATLDSLTGLLNRRTIENDCFKEFADGSTLVSTAIIDIDNFKSINDNYGHQVGDAVIKYVADVIIRCCNNIPLIGRIGGEEFLIIFPYTNLVSACKLVEKIRDGVSSAVITENRVRVTVSIGCAQRKQNESYDSLFRRADDALYNAKHNGKNQVICA